MEAARRYTLGALTEIEALIGGKLCEKFDLIFGTSTGAIIAALLGLSYAVNDVSSLQRPRRESREALAAVSEVGRPRRARGGGLRHAEVRLFPNTGGHRRDALGRRARSSPWSASLRICKIR
jgi:hypothetical protein